MTPPEIDIADWRRAVFALYADVRATKDSAAAQAIWRAGREALFRRHPQSPLLDEPHRDTWTFHTYPYDIALRHLVGLQEPVTEHSLDVPVGEEGVLQLRPFARTLGLADTLGSELTLYWIDGYGGGLFLPFADTTNGGETYGGGRYVLDTIKGADLGRVDDKLVVDFNFAYQPSCSYSPRWTCPLPSPENTLAVPIRAGERLA